MYTGEEISTWVSTPWKNESCSVPWAIRGISHDTRTLKAGDVYLAIRGENHDGHVFVEKAVALGAVGVIVEREFPNLGTPQLIVCDTMQALWGIATGARATWSGVVIGITGSAGKTTVKEMVASVLSQRGVVAKTLGNWNNEIGLPLSMIAADRKADFFVFELGMSHPGEIEPLAKLLKPDWALITNIGKAHIEFFQGLEGIAQEKAAILKDASFAIFNEDSEWFDRLQSSFCGESVSLTSVPFTVSQPGEHMVLNARFAATFGLALGLSVKEVQAGLDEFENAPMRWEKTEQGGVTLINDAYNANPLSMRAALSTFAALPSEGRKFAVLGGMRELGVTSEEEHRALGGFVDALHLDGVITVGELGSQICCAGERGLEKSAALCLLKKWVRAGDQVLFKASRGEHLETLVDEWGCVVSLDHSEIQKVAKIHGDLTEPELDAWGKDLLP